MSSARDATYNLSCSDTCDMQQDKPTECVESDPVFDRQDGDADLTDTNIADGDPTVFKHANLVQQCPMEENHNSDIGQLGFAQNAPENALPASTGFLILEDRPSNLPAKNPREKKRHVKQYTKLMNSLKKRYAQEQKGTHAANETDLGHDRRQRELVQTWRLRIIPHWKKFSSTKRVRRLIWEGIPSVVRRDVWWLLAGDSLNIDRALFEQCLELSHERLRASSQCAVTTDCSTTETNGDKFTCPMCSMVFTNLNTTPLQHEFCLGYNEDSCSEDYNARTTSACPSSPAPLTPPVSPFDRAISLRSIRLDVSRTFPTLGLFQPGSPYHDPLHDLLAAYVAYKPEIGYVQGMSFLAAILLLVMHDTFDAFVMFANILERPCHRAFYSLDENEFIVYFRAFDQTLQSRLPRLHAHFKRVGLEPNMYLFDWFFTIFSRSLPFETDIRVWDLFFLDGELALFRAALGILQLYETQLLHSNFDQLALFLTGSLPSDLSADCLVKQMRLIHLEKKDISRRVSRVRLNLREQLSPAPPSRSKSFLIRCATLADMHGAYSCPSFLEDAPTPHFISRSGSISISPPSAPLRVAVDHSVVSLCSASGSPTSLNSDDVDPGDLDYVSARSSDSNSSSDANLCGSKERVKCDSSKQKNRHSPKSSLPLCPVLTRSHSARATHSRPSESPCRSTDQRLRVCIQRVIERVP